MASVFDELNLRKLAGVTVQVRLPRGRPVNFALVFATQQPEVDAVAARLAHAAPPKRGIE
jgi:hypothetical protein